MFAFIHQWFSDSSVELDGLSEQEVELAVETAINKTDKRLRLVGNYQRKLRPAVVEALLHARELIHQIPGPVEINRSTYAHDVLVHSLFGSADQVNEVFSLSADAQAFAKKVWSSGNDHLFGLLLMTLNRKSRPGFVLNGDMVQGDVMQKIVFFSDHALVKVAGSEEQVRTMLRERALEGMFQAYKRRVAENTRQSNELKREQARLRREANPRDQDRLAEVERELKASSQSLLHIDDHLDLLIEVLTNPNDHCGLEHREVHLDRDGVDRGAAGEDGYQVPFAEITVGEVQRAGLLVKYPLNELLDMNHLHSLPNVAY